MKKYRFIPLLLAAALTLSVTVGCSDDGKSSSGSTSSSYDGHLEGIAENEITGVPNEEASGNETVFILNSVTVTPNINDSKMENIYLDVTIKNNTDTEYNLSALNNFYLLLSDGSESQFDITTQLYAQKNVEGYITNPFNVPKNGEFSGLIGGFIVDKGTRYFTVCFFPTRENISDKKNVIKVPVKAENFK